MDVNKYVNKVRSPPRFRKIRSLGKDQDRGIVIKGVTIPEIIAEQFQGVYFTIKCNNTQIILESGCPTGGFK